MTDDASRNDTRLYLHVMPRYPGTNRWHVFQISDESPRIALAASVASYTEAHKLATRDKQQLRFAEQAWRQMAAVGAAPDTVPDEVTIVSPAPATPQRS
jgi:hypothetical protein